jgi:poly(beta-D-mannuronate) lyase
MTIYNINLSELNSLMPKLFPGDIIIIEDGIFSDVNLNLTCKGELRNKITIKSKNPGKLIITGKSKIIISGNYTTLANIIFKDGGLINGIDISGIGNRLTGCDISFNNSDGPVILLKGIKNRIDHCILQNFSNAGVWLCLQRDINIIDYCIIDHNIFRNRAKGNGNGFETIRLGTSGSSLTNSRTIVRDNLFEKCDGEIEIISSKSCENIIYRNTVLESLGSITLRHGNRCILSKNKILQNYKNESGGLRVAAGEEHIIFDNLMEKTINSSINLNSGTNSGIFNLPIINNQITKNISINCLTDYSIGSDKFFIQPDNCIYSYNTTYKTTDDPVFNINQNVTNIFYENNQYYAKNIGENRNNGEILSDPINFDISKINYDLYGYNDNIGTDWNNLPENTEIGIDFEVYYNKLKGQIISELSKY